MDLPNKAERLIAGSIGDRGSRGGRLLNSSSARTLLGVSLLLLVMAANAETYTAKLYGVPSGYDSMMVYGAGDYGVMAGAGRRTGSTENQAMFFTNSGTKNLHPAGWTNSSIHDAYTTGYYVGSGTRPGGEPHALFWVGGGAPVDLHPGAPWRSSTALGVFLQTQVGAVTAADFSSTACRWLRKAETFRTLSAPGFTNTMAASTDGTAMGGYGVELNTNRTHGLYWPDVNSSAVKLSPAGMTESMCLSVNFGVQAGFAYGLSTGHKRHAVTWFGSANSMMDYHPGAFFSETTATGCRGNMIIGTGTPITTPLRTQAIAWHLFDGPAGWINLHFRLPYPFIFWSSTATDIDGQGNIVGYVTSPDGRIRRPVIWIRS